MQPERTDLDPPKDDPFTQEQLKAYDGTDASKPVYVAIKGTIVPLSTRLHYHPFSCYPSFALTLRRVYTYPFIFCIYRNGFRRVTEARNVRAWWIICSISRQGRISRTWIVEPEARGRSGGLEQPRREGTQNSRRLAYFLYVRVLILGVLVSLLVIDSCSRSTTGNGIMSSAVSLTCPLLLRTSDG
jgi:hypothetical protein